LAVTLLADRPKLSFAAVSAALALGLAALSRRRLLEIKPQTMLGDASLTIYLIHVPHSSPLFWLGYFAAVLAIAWLVNHWY
jgi:peptidoglycan/LPS O-acetylase OafA/YrhL